MKCDNCGHKRFHRGGSLQSVAEGGDDPYDYEYCAKGHWADEGTTDEQCGEDVKNNFWADCKDFKDKE